MKIRKVGIKQTRGPNAKDLVSRTMEPPVQKSKKTCIQGTKVNPVIKKPPRTKETREKEVRENKRDAFLLFLQQEKEEETNKN